MLIITNWAFVSIVVCPRRTCITRTNSRW